MRETPRAAAGEGSAGLDLLERQCLRDLLLIRLRRYLEHRHPALRVLLREQGIDGDLHVRLRIEEGTDGVELALGRPGLAAELIRFGADPFAARAATTYTSASSLDELADQIFRAEQRRPGVLAAWTCVAALAEAYADRSNDGSSPLASGTSSKSRTNIQPTVLRLFGPRPTP